MRKYQPIWLALKSSKSYKIKVAVPNSLQKRTVKAVLKEKDMDTLFKLETAELGKKAWITYEYKPGLIELKLNYSLTIDGALS